MADQIFNISKGRFVEFYNRVESNDPANAALIVVVCKLSEVDATLIDYADLGALLAAPGNTEADFTNYARKVLTDVELAALPAPDNANDKYNIDIPNQTWTAAGGATNNTTTKLIICYDADTTGGTDSNIIPISHYDFVATTDGNDLTAKPHVDGICSAT